VFAADQNFSILVIKRLGFGFSAGGGGVSSRVTGCRRRQQLARKLQNHLTCWASLTTNCAKTPPFEPPSNESLDLADPPGTFFSSSSYAAATP
jgi:hypothetical protein